MWSRVSERARVCTRAAAFAYCTQTSGSNTTSSFNSNTAEWSSAASLELYREHLFLQYIQFLRNRSDQPPPFNLNGVKHLKGVIKPRPCITGMEEKVGCTGQNQRKVLSMDDGTCSTLNKPLELK